MTMIVFMNMRAARFLSVLLFAVTALLRADAKMVDRAPVGVIPFTLSDDGRMFVTAFVNGSDSLRFLVDTGASFVALNVNSPKLNSCLRKGVKGSSLGTTGIIQLEYSKGNVLRAGSMRWGKLWCAHLSWSPDSWDGILGLGALSSFNVEFNYDDLKIYFYPRKKVKANPSYVALPFVYKYGVPFVTLPVRLDGTLYRLLLEVDTGSNRIFDLSAPFVGRNRILERLKPFAVAYIKGVDGGIGKLKHVYFDEVIVGPYVLSRVPGACSLLASGMLGKEDIDGMLGNNFLKRFNMLIDFKGKTMYLQPDKLLNTPFAVSPAGAKPD